MRQLKITNKITSRESLSLDKYLNDISKIEMLTPEEEVELARRIRETEDEEALEKLTKSNLRFVVSVAKQYQNQGDHPGAPNGQDPDHRRNRRWAAWCCDRDGLRQVRPEMRGLHGRP